MTNTYNAAYILFTVHCTGGQSVYSHCALNYYMTINSGLPHNAASICLVYAMRNESVCKLHCYSMSLQVTIGRSVQII